jgi:membrane-associated protease RseP (regulator of RpoE activity)
MTLGRICILASIVFLCLDHQAAAQPQDQQSPANPHSGNLIIDVDDSRSRTFVGDLFPQAIKGYNENFVLWNTPGNGLGWFETTNQPMGMSLTPADDALRAHLQLPKDQGLIVTSLDVHSPAAQAGIELNDILLALQNVVLGKPADLEDGLKAVGDKPVAVKLLRGGKNIVIQVQPRVHVGLGPVQREAPAFWIGVSVSPVEPALRSQLKLPENTGLLATEVFKDSPAAKVEIKVHDILTKLAGKPLDSQEKLVELVQANGGKSIAIEFIREGKTQTNEVTPQPRKNGTGNNAANNSAYFYQFAGPGTVTPYHLPLRLSDRQDLVIANQLTAPAQSLAADAGIPKRLDDLDAEIKQLRQAIEELSKAIANKK